MKIENIKNHAGRLARNIDRELSMRKGMLQGLCNKHLIRVTDETDSPLIKSRMKKLLYHFNSAESIFILDTRGDIIFTNTNDIQMKNYGTRDFFKNAMNIDTYVSEPAIDNGKGYIYYSAPIKNYKKEIIGVLVMRRPADELWKIFEEEKDFPEKGSFCILTDAYGIRIAHTADRSLIFKSWAALDPDVKDKLETEHHYGEDVKEIGSTNIPGVSKAITKSEGLYFIHPLAVNAESNHGYCISLKEKNWKLIYTIPHHSFIAPVKQMTQNVVFSTGIVFLVVITLTWLLSASLVRPIKRLISAVTEIAGDNLEHPITDKSQDEIGSLMHAFEVMKDKLKDSYNDLKDANIESILMLARACEVRDEDTGNHVLRINHYSVALAKEMGLDEPFIKELGPSSILHDVGKIHVPDYVLRKKWYFTDKEREGMKKHPLYGERILSGGNHFFKIAGEIARWHHENWDGTGYPDGLQDEAIPISARIVRVADTYDALVMTRPYKGAWPDVAAYDEIVKHSGTYFDPVVVEAFKRLFEKGVFQEIKRKYAQYNYEEREEKTGHIDKIHRTNDRRQYLSSSQSIPL